MRIVILSQYFLPEMGAPQNRLYELAQGLVNKGWQVSVVTALPNYPTGKIFPKYRGAFHRKEHINGIEVTRYWLFASNSPKALPRVVSMLSFSATALLSIFFIRSKKPDFLLIESPPLTLAITGWLLATTSGSRMIMNVSDLWPLSALELGAISEGRVFRILVALEHFLYKRAFLCTGQSQEIVDHIKKISGNTYLFRNGVDTSRFENSKADPTKRNILVYAGLLGVAQGVLAICENINFDELGVQFHIYGSGSEKERIEKYILEFPAHGVHYKGAISRDEMPGMLASYGGSLIVLVKNIYGAVPSKIYEAMAAGLPIVFSGEGEGAEIIKAHEAGWVSTPGQWASLRNAILEFRNMDRNRLDLMRARNRETALKNFDRSKQIEQLSNRLQSIR